MPVICLAVPKGAGCLTWFEQKLLTTISILGMSKSGQQVVCRWHGGALVIIALSHEPVAPDIGTEQIS